MYYSAQTYLIDTKEWTTTEFETRKEVVDFIDSQFKYPSEYNLKYTNGYWNEQGRIWATTGSYPIYVNKSLDFRKHWDNEKKKCDFEGFIIYKSEKENITFALPGLFYWYLNYCPIVNKVKQGMFLPDIYDGDYHYFLYILRCILHRKYGVVLKKRQAGYTLKNMAIILNAIWFGNAAITKVFASDITKVEESWVFMEYYRDHINKFTGWKRGLSPNKTLNWKLRRQTNTGGWIGNQSSAKGFTTQQSPTSGVGGSAKVIFGEEAGINPTLDVTHEYITSNVAMGGLTTGLIIYSGAVGELNKAEPLKNFILKPTDNDFLPCKNNIPDDAEFGSEVGFFAPEWWNYVTQADDTGEIIHCYDEWGNTDKEKAMHYVMNARKNAEKKKSQSYRYFCSQRPLSIKEAFAYRNDAYFPQDLVVNQMMRHEAKPPTLKEVVLYENENGKIAWRSRKPEEYEPASITKFPLDEKDDKRGCVVIKEFPEENPERFTYFAGVDDIATDRSKTSESLFTVVIFKNIKEIKYQDGDEIKTRVEGNEPVAWYTGRMEDMKSTHTIAEYLIRYYNAFAAIENNVQNFIQHMQSKGLQYLMATKSDMPFVKDLQANKDVSRDYGVYIASNGTVKDYLLANAKQYITEILDVKRSTVGEIVKTTYGIERISDMGLLREIQKFHKDLNVDRLIAFMLAQSITKSFQVQGIIKRENQIKEKEPEEKPIVQRSFFKNLDSSLNGFKVQKSYFKQHG